MTDAELRDAALAELKQTTVGWLKTTGTPRYPSGTAPATTHWGKAMSLLEQIGAAPPPPPPTTAHQLPTHNLVLGAGDVATWLTHDSPTTQILPPGTSGNYRDKHRIVRWAPDGLYAARRMYAVFGFRLISGCPGRMYDWHTQPNDVGSWFPPCSNGVAPIAFDYWGGGGGPGGQPDGLLMVIEPEDDCVINGVSLGGTGKHWNVIFTDAEMEARRGQWVWLWMDMTWGRIDTAIKGAMKVWVAGEDTPRVNVSGINTHYKDEQMVTYWLGTYHCKTCRGAGQRHELDVAATRFGRTPKEAYEDVPVLYTCDVNSPASSCTPIAPRLSTEAVIPSELRW